MAKKEKCIHHWVIETASGPFSKGICQHCNKKKTFENSITMNQLSLSTSNRLEGSLNN